MLRVWWIQLKLYLVYVKLWRHILPCSLKNYFPNNNIIMFGKLNKSVLHNIFHTSKVFLRKAYSTTNNCPWWYQQWCKNIQKCLWNHITAISRKQIHPKTCKTVRWSLRKRIKHLWKNRDDVVKTHDDFRDRLGKRFKSIR